ncbi:MAG TPA: AcvB/VirJ family lysyl-phosphatidylglycerol hydrolase [Hanamia sp.]|nr:AcvB/VirJ family lysyl-phosphatidylglycerol hydrolase [Hanamia sp.]
MNKYLILLCFFIAPFFKLSTLYAQDLPLKEWSANTHEKPLIFYISGDGGMNKFSTSLCEELNSKGFDVIALNARSYFWDKKTPELTASDVNNLLTKKLSGRKNQQIVMIGYSFGADVLPFILNRLPKNTDDKVLVSYLLASSGSTDFEIHWADIFGSNTKRSMDVVSEINKLTDEKVVIISASDDKTLAVNKITLKRFTHEMLPGGHHFDGDTDEIVNAILTDMD